MTDLEIAQENLGDHSVCFCKNGSFFTEDGRGISPLIRLIDESRDLSGYAAADRIVGKAAAMLFVKADVSAVYGRVTSAAAKEYLDSRGIPCTFGTLTEKIINRSGDDICPMEKTVTDIDDPEEAYSALKERLSQLRKGI